MLRSPFLKKAGVAVAALALLVVVGVWASSCGAAGVGAQGLVPVDRVGPAPAFSGVTLDGKTVSLDQFRGKPLFLVYMTST